MTSHGGIQYYTRTPSSANICANNNKILLSKTEGANFTVRTVDLLLSVELVNTVKVR
jgi:hypothetical protein